MCHKLFLLQSRGSSKFRATRKNKFTGLGCYVDRVQIGFQKVAKYLFCSSLFFLHPRRITTSEKKKDFIHRSQEFFFFNGKNQDQGTKMKDTNWSKVLSTESVNKYQTDY